jgi:EAL domain-containing protein (putative c-di-GMP-specific phosphodiesterase class I)/GGDEF domain-containing protein
MNRKAGFLSGLFAARAAMPAASDGAVREVVAAIASAVPPPVEPGFDPPALVARLDDDLKALTGSDVLALLIVGLARSDSIDATLESAGAAAVQAAILERIRSTLRPQDYLTRATFDEIWVVLPGLSSPAIANLAATNIAYALETPFIGDHAVVTVRPGIGIAVASDPQRSGLGLLKSAAHARFRARTLNQPYFVTSAGEDNEQLSRDLVKSLEVALSTNILSLAYQPKVDLRSRTVLSVEALIRWPGDVTPVMTPTSLVAIAEEFGMMEELTRYVLQTALSDYVNFLKGAGVGRIWINLSARMLCEPHLPDLLQQALDIWNVPPSALGLEVTESTLITDIEQSISMLHMLKGLGFEMAIDDFGTGYSSLAYLRRFPISELKIDKIFVQHMIASEPDMQIVRSIIDLAHNFGLKVVAEGVEDEATLVVLRGMACDQIQGYVFSKALPPREFVAWAMQFAAANRAAKAG